MKGDEDQDYDNSSNGNHLLSLNNLLTQLVGDTGRGRHTFDD